MAQSRTFPFAVLLGVIVIFASRAAHAQNFERYQPRTLGPADNYRPNVPLDEPGPVTGSDEELVDSLDAVIVLDHTDKVQPENDFKDAIGIHYDFHACDSLVYSAGFQNIVNGYLGAPITLRGLNEMAREIILFYRHHGLPVVDVLTPEQKITAGSVQIVVVESRIGEVRVEGACHFDPCMLANQIHCTWPGSRIYEQAIAADLRWLNRNAFRRVNIDLRAGAAEGITDVVYEVYDVLPARGYMGYEDTGVRSLGLERLYAGFICGNAFGIDGTLSYQYTTDGDLRRLHAHSFSYVQPIDLCFEFNTYGSWAGVTPDVQAINQRGESWQLGMGLTAWCTRTQYWETSLSAGVDFKTTNNNLEFAGINVFNSEADLLQMRIGMNHLRRNDCGEYFRLSNDIYIGPGGGFSSQHNTAAFNTIRANTSPDYVYDRLRAEWLCNVGHQLQFSSRFIGQVASERLLFSETLGLGGYDTIRGYDQRSLSGDGGWIANLELGPRPCVFGHCGQTNVRLYGFGDLGQAFIIDALPGEDASQSVASAGIGMRMNIGDYFNLRLDYGHAFTTLPGQLSNDRIHLGVVYLPGPRP